jgi:hypothetical protein
VARPQDFIAEMALYNGKGNASTPREGFIPNPKLKLLEQVSEVMRLKHYSPRMERTYQEWIRRYVLFHGKRHPREMGAGEIERFLSELAVRRVPLYDPLLCAVAERNRGMALAEPFGGCKIVTRRAGRPSEHARARVLQK